MVLLHARDNNIQSFACIWLYKGNQNEFLKRPQINSSGRKLTQLVRLAQVVEQWTGNPEVGGSSPPSNYLIFGC